LGIKDTTVNLTSVVRNECGGGGRVVDGPKGEREANCGATWYKIKYREEKKGKTRAWGALKP